jgi:hypothetical protein
VRKRDITIILLLVIWLTWGVLESVWSFALQ